jgi:hypothetical protein
MPNPYDVYDTAGEEISSTYEGRHITFPETYLTHPTHADGLVDGKDPILVGENIVGVAFSDATGVNDLIAIDTEGIWALTVVAQDDWGNSAVARGDEIFINKTTCALSKIRNKNTHQHFGYALTTLNAGSTDVVAVKVHWDPDDAEEVVGQGAVFYSSAKDSFNFREYRYRTTATTGDIRGMYMALGINGAVVGSGEAVRSRTIVEAVGVQTAHGLHAGLEFDADGTITGLGVGLRGTFMQPSRDAFATIAGGMSELWAEGAATDFSTATVHSIHRFVMDGDGTGRATAQNVFEFSNLSATQYAANTDTPDHALRCIINGNVRYIMVSEAQS